VTTGGRRIGPVEVAPIGLGAMPLSVGGRPDEAQAVATIHAALDAGVHLIDTADAYCLDSSEIGHNEELGARAVRSWRGAHDSIVIATKGGHVRDQRGRWLLDSSPAYLRRACEQSLLRLRVEAIALYQHHRPDPTVPYEESIGTLRDLQQEGKIRMVGIGNANLDQIRRALDLVDVASVQNEFSPDFTSSTDEVEFCAARGIAFLAWAPLGGMTGSRDIGVRHPAFAAVADEVGVSVQRVVLAWVLTRSATIIPIPGSRRPATILDSVAAAGLELSAEQLRRLDDEVGLATAL